MKTKILFCLIALCLSATLTVSAKKKKKKKTKNCVTLVTAFSQRIVPGIPGPPPPTGVHFVIVWQGDKYPETFFWRGDGGWLSCNVAKAKKIVNRKYIRAEYREYEASVIAIDKIKKGDTLQLDPVTGGKFPIPKEIPETAQNTLFYKTGGSGWLSCHVDSIRKVPDIIRP